MALIEVRNLTKAFGPTTAVDHLSFDIIKGETLGLVGESGSGKSTLARLLLKLIEQDAGTIAYGGEVGNVRRDLQIVFQDPQTSLNPRIRVGEAVMEPVVIHQLLPKEKQKDRLIELLAAVKLPLAYARRYPHELSGGERQRIGIARALASNPKFLILDEPVSALDVSIQVDILQLLKEIKERLKLTYLFIAHDLNVIGYMSDRIAVLKDGKIVELGAPAEILATPHHPYTQKLLSATLKLF